MCENLRSCTPQKYVVPHPRSAEGTACHWCTIAQLRNQVMRCRSFSRLKIRVAHWCLLRVYSRHQCRYIRLNILEPPDRCRLGRVRTRFIESQRIRSVSFTIRCQDWKAMQWRASALLCLFGILGHYALAHLKSAIRTRKSRNKIRE